MVVDILWKLFRKMLPLNCYEFLKKSRFGRYAEYFSADSFDRINERYRQAISSVEGMVILEVGPGIQFYTALDFLNRGASKVMLVDPVFIQEKYQQILEKNYNEYFSNHKKNYQITTDTIKVYSSWDLLPASLEHTVDAIYSHFVLEHVVDLNDFFRQSYRLLKKRGRCYSMVDLSDHSYQIFDSKPWTMWIYKERILYHLKYSDKINNLLSDRRTWVNRSLFPSYTCFAKDNGFEVCSSTLNMCKKSIIHKDVTAKLPQNYIGDELYVSHFELMLSAK
jgi:ubiquinone/menaquinone biosynthesis C-methylase UbiE